MKVKEPLSALNIDFVSPIVRVLRLRVVGGTVESLAHVWDRSHKRPKRFLGLSSASTI